MTRRVLVIGSGKRVVEAALPAFLRLPEQFSIDSVVARKPKTIAIEGRSFEVTPLDALDPERFARFDLIYMVVAKHAVPAVLRRLAAFERSNVELLIDTPVLLFKHMGRLDLLSGYRAVWVSEDCTTLPVWDALAAFQETGGVGALTHAHFDRSAYAYHAVAMGRTVLAAGRVRSARSARRGSGTTRRYTFDGGGELVVEAPRDYAVGRMTLEGPGGRISDDPRADAEHALRPLVEEEGGGTRLLGFELDGHEARLREVERSLVTELGPAGEPAPGVTTWMEGMKRVGFLRLLERIHAGEGAYPLAEAIEDTIVDYHLERFGRWIPGPFTDPRRTPARAVLAAFARCKGV